VREGRYEISKRSVKSWNREKHRAIYPPTPLEITMTPRGTLLIPINGLGQVPKVGERWFVRQVEFLPASFYQIIR
jgi:hypothetical protein